MLDPKFIRENSELVKRAVQLKREKADVDRFLELDRKRRELLQEVEELKRQRNLASEEIGRLKREGLEASEQIEDTRKVGEKIKHLDRQLADIEEQIHAILIWVPNIPHESVPIGSSAENNVEVRRWGGSPEMDFTPKPHWEIAESLGLVDFKRGSKTAGTFFVSFRGYGARLERALIHWMLDLHIEKHGFTEVSPPYVVNEESMFATGQLPKLRDDMYYVDKEGLFLIPTAEVPVTNLLRGEVLRQADLPIYYTAYTPCFRSEAGAYGADTRGLMRIHQFDKVEMVKFVPPETSYEELEALVADAEEVLQLLKLPYRVLELCTADLSFAAAKCYDLEVWAPGVERWLEVSSCSNFEDFQARRANIRYRRDATGKLEYVHTLNGSGLALPRTVIGILENYQTDEGTVIVPEVLRPYMGVDVFK